MKASKRFGCALVVTTLCLVLSSCGGGPTGPEFTRADGEAFRQIGEQWSTAFNAGDIESLASMFAGTGAVMPPNSSTVRGHESITGYYTQMFNEGERNLEVEISEVGGEGDLGYVSGTFLNITQIPVQVDDDEGDVEEDAVDELLPPPLLLFEAIAAPPTTAAPPATNVPVDKPDATAPPISDADSSLLTTVI